MRIILITVIILGSIGPGFAESAVFREFPTLADQIKEIAKSPKDIDPSAALLARYLEISNEEIVKGMKLVLQEDTFLTQPENKRHNYALELLVYLLKNGCGMPGETMPLALALANNSVYANGDETIKKEIRKDILAHYKFYRKVAEWQRKIQAGWDISEMPFFAQLCWADRTFVWETHSRFIDNCKDRAEYREYVTRIETLDELHETFVKNIKASSVEEWANALENAANSRFIYAEQDNGGLNSQLKRYRGKKKFQGHCGSYTSVQLGLYAAAGIPATGCQMTLVDKSLNHAYSLYYHPASGKWKAFQNVISKDHKTLIIYQIALPARHHWLPVVWKEAPNYWFSSRFKGDYITSRKLSSLNTCGIENRLMEELFIMEPVQKSGFFEPETNN